MSYIDKNLLTGEQIIYRTKKHLIIFITPVIWTLALLICLMNSNPFVVKFSILPGIVALGSWLNTLLIYVTSEFVITNKRIMMKEGFFVRHSNEIRLSTVAQVSVTQSLIGQLLDYGAVFINAFGAETDSFTAINHPIQFQKLVQEQLGAIGNSTMPAKPH
jgi:uncharacterized membrane protein YdbT with pleckstrin-like domain